MGLLTTDSLIAYDALMLLVNLSIHGRCKFLTTCVFLGRCVRRWRVWVCASQAHTLPVRCSAPWVRGEAPSAFNVRTRRSAEPHQTVGLLLARGHVDRAQTQAPGFGPTLYHLDLAACTSYHHHVR